VKTFLHAIATGFYTGYLPWAPGTWATILIGIPLYTVVHRLGNLGYAIVLALLLILSIYSAGATALQKGQDDPHCIVIDEVVGYLFAMICMPCTITNIAVSCAFFRLFDIIKPYPISLADRKVTGGLGITLDDVLAGVFANLSLRLVTMVV